MGMATDKLYTLMLLIGHVEGIQWDKLLVSVDIAVAAGIDLNLGEIEMLRSSRLWLDYVELVAGRYRSRCSAVGFSSLNIDEVTYNCWVHLLVRGEFEDFVTGQVPNAMFYWGIVTPVLYYIRAKLRIKRSN